MNSILSTATYDHETDWKARLLCQNKSDDGPYYRSADGSSQLEIGQGRSQAFLTIHDLKIVLLDLIEALRGTN
jgi:hypothetical protein